MFLEIGVYRGQALSLATLLPWHRCFVERAATQNLENREKNSLQF